MIAEPPRLGDLAPARLGRADCRVHQGKAGRLGRDPAGPGCRTAHRRGLRERGRRRLVQDGRARALPRQARQRRLEKSRRHLDVWFDSGSTHAFVLEDPVHFPHARRHQAQGRRRQRHGDVSGRLGPAPRLVPFLAAWKAAARAGARRSTWCSRTASCSTSRAARCRSRSATSPRRRT